MCYCQPDIRTPFCDRCAYVMRNDIQSKDARIKQLEAENEELKRKLEEQTKLAETYFKNWHTTAGYEGSMKAAQALLARKEKKLAEQQAQYAMLRGWFEKDNSCTCNTCWQCAGKGAAMLSDTANKEELSALLAKAKEEGRKEAVPEGWQVVPKEPTEEWINRLRLKGWHTHYKLDKTIISHNESLIMDVLSAAPKPEGEVKCQ